MENNLNSEDQQCKIHLPYYYKLTLQFYSNIYHKINMDKTAYKYCCLH